MMEPNDLIGPVNLGNPVETTVNSGRESHHDDRLQVAYRVPSSAAG